MRLMRRAQRLHAGGADQGSRVRRSVTRVTAPERAFGRGQDALRLVLTLLRSGPCRCISVVSTVTVDASGNGTGASTLPSGHCVCLLREGAVR